MCMEDVRLGRQKYGRVDLIPVAGATPNVQLLGADPHRTTLLLTSTDGSVFWISDKPMTATAQGLRVAANNTNLADFRVEDHGNFVTKDIFAWSDVGCTVAVLAASLSKE